MAKSSKMGRGIIATLLPVVIIPMVVIFAATGGYVVSQESPAGSSGVVDASGWAWPSDIRSVSQSFHDGFSIDLATTPGGALYAPYDGVVVVAGFDNGKIPGVCLSNPSWWHGPNHTVIMRHELPGGTTLYSSHNHIQQNSPAAAGIEVGSVVKAGQQVASSGMSGCTSGPHTHFTLSRTQSNASADINPTPYLGVPSP